MSKNALGTWYESSTIFQFGEFVAKDLQIARMTTYCVIQLRSSRTEYVSANDPIICQFVAIRGIRKLCGIGVLERTKVYTCFNSRGDYFYVKQL